MPLQPPPSPTKIACVGDSITFGADIADRERASYPGVLGGLLGLDYDVRNFGVSGATMVRAGDQPYWKETAFAAATAFAPHIVVLKLGTNDSKPENWNPAAFRSDGEAMIAHFTALPTSPRIFLCLPAPAYVEAWGISETRLEQARGIIRELATANALPAIDLVTPLSGRPEWFPDGVHPNAEGAAEIARTVFAALREEAVAPAC